MRTRCPARPTDSSPRTDRCRDNAARSQGRACWGTASPMAARWRRSTRPVATRCGHDDELGVQLVSLVDEAQDLADRQAMAHREREKIESPLLERTRSLHVPLPHDP